MDIKFKIGNKVRAKDQKKHKGTLLVTDIHIDEDGIGYKCLPESKESQSKAFFLEESLEIAPNDIYVVVAKDREEHLVWETMIEGATKERAIEWCKKYGYKYKTRIAKLVFVDE